MVYLSLGSNLGDRYAQLNSAVEQIATRVGQIEKISPIYETAAWGFDSSPFYNACLSVNSSLHPNELLAEIMLIEQEMGRIRSEEQGYQPRTIDLDILLFDSLQINSASLIIPHPRMELRRFILQPLADIAAEIIHPIHQKNIHTLLRECKDSSEIQMIYQDITPSNTFEKNPNTQFLP
jgi:2-amino-4-hydroxy-6-hydroxymethyldihydropteridine diphosphokinase